ncbi:unnamed protein product [Closterium sp. Naga37s-1]|nr:unnamed protein product [Closterium sp. Naga37s-1]
MRRALENELSGLRQLDGAHGGAAGRAGDAVRATRLPQSFQEVEERMENIEMLQRDLRSALQIGPTEADQLDKEIGGGAEKARAEESSKVLELLSHADMVHYLDVTSGWDEDLCACCFDRAVSQRARRALAMKNLEDLRRHLRKQQPRCIPAATPEQQRHNQAAFEASKGTAPQALQEGHRIYPQAQFGSKPDRAPRLCAEAMVLEWMAEPRVGVLMDLRTIRSRLPAILQRESDSFASMLVQVLGVKERADLKEGFGFFVQHVLSGRVEEAHAEGRGGAGGMAAEEGHEEGSGRGEAEAKAAEKTHGGGKGRCEASHGKDDGRHGEDEAGSKVAIDRVASKCGRDSKDLSWREHLKGRVWERPEHWKDAELCFHDGNTASKMQVESAAIQVAGKRLLQQRLKQRRGMDGVAGAGVQRASPAPATASADMNARLLLVNGVKPVNTNSVVAAFTYRVACILQWVRVYGSDSTSEEHCFTEQGSHSNVLPMRHPLRDLPSLLVRFGAIPRPLEGSNNLLEWEEWPGGDEAAVKFPVSRKERCFGLGIVELRGEVAKKLTQHPPQHTCEAGKSRRRATEEGARQEAEERRACRSNELRVALPPPRRKLPIIRCQADVEFLVQVAGAVMDPPACAHCKQCSADFMQYACTVALIANFAYRPVSHLFSRVLSVFPLSSPGRDELVDCLEFPARLPRPLNLHLLLRRAEQVPLYFLLHMAIWCAQPLLHRTEFTGYDDTGTGQAVGSGASKGDEKKGGNGGRVEVQGHWDGEEDQENGGEVWEEVRMWYSAAMAGWRFNVGDEGESDECRNSGKRASVDEDCNINWILRPWPGGVNLVACLREMLLGEPCYRPASPATPPTTASHAAPSAPPAPSTPAASSTYIAAAMSSCAAASPTLAATSIRAAAALGVEGSESSAVVTLGSDPAASGGHMCGAAGCGRAEGGGVKLRRCSGCGKVAYCSRECQKAHWPSHRLTCPGRTSGKNGGNDGDREGCYRIGKASGCDGSGRICEEGGRMNSEVSSTERRMHSAGHCESCEEGGKGKGRKEE